MPRGRKLGELLGQRVVGTRRQCCSCGEEHDCDRPYCLPCWRDYQAAYRARAQAPARRRRPPPPPGFSPSDLTAGKPVM